MATPFGSRVKLQSCRRKAARLGEQGRRSSSLSDVSHKAIWWFVQQSSDASSHALEGIPEILFLITQYGSSGKDLYRALTGGSPITANRLGQAASTAEHGRTLSIGTRSG